MTQKLLPCPLTYEEARQAIRWAKDTIKGGYTSGSAGNLKRRNMKILLKLAKAQLKHMKAEQHPQPTLYVKHIDGTYTPAKEIE